MSSTEPLAFTPPREERFQWLLGRYPDRMGALLPALRLAEEQWGNLTLPVQRYVADRLEIPPAHVYGVVTFYTHFRTDGTGKHCIQVCSTLPCALRGSQSVLEYLEKKLGIRCGETTPDGRITLKKVECLGSCGSAPMMQVDDDYHELLTPELIDQLLQELGS